MRWTVAGRMACAGAALALLAACGGSNTAKNNGGNAANTGGAATNSAAATTPGAGSAATAQAAAGEKVQRGGTLTVAIDSNLKNLDPLLSSLVVDRQVMYQIYDSLVTIGPDLKIAPGLADSWDTSDPKAIVFKLHSGVKFQDGTDFDATAVKFNIDRILTTKSSPRLSEINSIASVDVIDPLTVRFNLKAPAAQLLAALVDRAGMMVSPTAVQKGGQDFTINPLLAGTGPFRFVEWKQDDHITVERNPNYWRKAPDGSALPYLDKVIFRVIVDENARLTNLKTGDVDMVYRPPAKDIASIKKDSSLVYKDTPSLDYAGIVLNTTTAPFNNVALRQAVAYAIDRNQILQTVAYGIGAVSNGPISPPMPAYDKSYVAFPLDLAKAKQKLQDGGMPNGFSFDLNITAGSPATEQEAALIKDELSKAGITVNILPEEFTKLIDDAAAHKFQASLQGWSGRIDPDGNTYNQFHTDGGLNYGSYSNPQVDKLLDDARTTYDQSQRDTMYRQVNALIAGDVAEVFINHGVSAELHTPKVHGYVNIADTVMRFAAVWKAQ